VGHLVVLTDKGNIWVRISPPYAFYGVDDMAELVRIINDVLSDKACFVIVTYLRKWSETTLVRPNATPRLDSRAGTVQVISWSGKHDRKFRLRKKQ